jgi:hypothetical protein
MAEKKILDLSFMLPPYDRIELPSRGIFYKDIPELAKGIVHVRAMSTTEEKLIDKFSQNTFYTIVDEIIGNCIKENVSVDDLTPGDRIFILFKIRALSYGSEYEIKFKCSECEAELPLKVNLAEFEPVYVNEDVEEPIELFLPITKAKVKMVIPRSGHMRESTNRSFAEQKKSGIFVSPAVYQKAICCIEFIFPESSADAGHVLYNNVAEDFKLILGIMSRLHVQDMKTIEDLFNDYDHGMIDSVTKYCPVCEEAYEQYLVLNWEFFRPSSKRKSDSDVQQFLFDVPDRERSKSNRNGTRRSGEARELHVDGYTVPNVLPTEEIS